MRLETLIREVTEYVTQKIRENQTVSDEDLPQTAKLIAMAALKYGDLSNLATKDYVFDLDRFSSFEGNTGPYILYTIVRIKSILAKYQGDAAAAELLPPDSAEQKALMLVLSRMQDALRGAYRDSAPNAICAYIYELAGAGQQVLSRREDHLRARRSQTGQLCRADGADARRAGGVHRSARLLRPGADVTYPTKIDCPPQLRRAVFISSGRSGIRRLRRPWAGSRRPNG